jgi:hypothetical protein
VCALAQQLRRELQVISEELKTTQDQANLVRFELEVRYSRQRWAANRARVCAELVRPACLCVRRRSCSTRARKSSPQPRGSAATTWTTKSPS